MKVYSDLETGKVAITRKVGRVLFMTYEHEALHAETLLYMLLQRAGTGTLPPPGFTAPPWSSLADTWNSTPGPKTKTVTLGPEIVTIGHDDPEEEDADPAEANAIVDHEFGWDNEHPKRQVQVEKYQIEWRPVTNGEFYEFYMGDGKGKVKLPASWVEHKGEIQVPLPLSSFHLRNSHLCAYRSAHSMGLFISDWHNTGLFSRHTTTCQDTPSSKAAAFPLSLNSDCSTRNFSAAMKAVRIQASETGTPLRKHGCTSFVSCADIDLTLRATAGGERNGGKGSNGGVWEWTSTTFDRFDGFVPSTLYPGYHLSPLNTIYANPQPIGTRWTSLMIRIKSW